MKRERAPERRGPGEGDRMALLTIFALVSRGDGRDNPVDGDVGLAVLGVRAWLQVAGDLDGRSLDQQVFGNVEPLPGEDDGVDEESGGALAEVVGKREACDLAVLGFEVAGVGGQAASEGEGVYRFHCVEC